MRRPVRGVVALGFVCALLAGCAHGPTAQATSVADPIPLPARLDNPDQVIVALADTERELKERGMPQASFFMAYVETNTAIRDFNRAGRFRDQALMSRYLVAFAREGYRSVELHQRDASAPEAWSVILDSRRSEDSSPTRCLLLGLNAHVNHDLPLTTLAAGVDPRCEQCVQDHRKIDAALTAALPRIREGLVDDYQPSLRWMSAPFGRIIDRVIADNLITARENALQAAAALVECDSAGDRRRVEQEIRGQSGLAARRILANRLGNRKALSIFRDALSVKPSRPVGSDRCRRHR